MRRKDVYAVIFVLAVCLLAYWEALSYPHESAYFPRIIIGLLALMTCILLGKLILAGIREKREGLQVPLEPGEKLPFWKQEVIRKVVIMLGGSIVYLLIMPSVGFFLTTLVYLPAMIRLLGVRKVRTIALSSFVVLFFIYLVFTNFLKVPLPEGIAF
ncbi:MAG: tripartite tricarboxylate transporter TctB family protein [Deltaproteobacteria bacterium]|nr:tripartite tricarboxylate transporter TctB family protein [Deltaproteobacteria bacterium]MBW2307090.1 tripartite tricarboxylate transporter TctB family protein [Deltaproteobacteria bacterium]